MKRLFDVTQVANDLVYFTILEKDPQKYDVKLRDRNSGLVIHFLEKWSMGPGSFYVGPHTMMSYSRNLSIEITDADSNFQSENITMNGGDRYPVVQGKKFLFAHNQKTSFFTLIEIFYMKIYERDFVRPEPNDVIVDIGANLGMFSVYAQNYQPSRVLAIEPSSEEFDKLTENAAHFSNIEVYKYAVSGESGESNLILFEGGVENHLEFVEHSNCLITGTEVVHVIGINEFIKDMNLERIDYLKVDCEGSEIDIFRAIDKNYLQNKVKKVALEYHSLNIKEELLNIFKENGFTLENTEILENDHITGMLYYYNKRFYN